MKPFPTDFYAYLQSHTLIGIKAGLTRPTFLEIWMVQVGERVFARSWEKSDKGWFATLVATGVGQIQYGSKVITITGKKLLNEPETQQLIHQAYLTKYHEPHNIPYAQGITQQVYEDFTIEIFFDHQN